MITIEQHLCNVMWRFVKAHTEEIKDSYEGLGFKNKTDMLNAIKVDWQTAWWALTELCAWVWKRIILISSLYMKQAITISIR